MRKKILVVEDQSDSCDLSALLLQIDGYDTVCAEDGRQGLDLAHQEHPDLIVTDIMMPKLDGIEMIKLLRKESEFASTPIIVLTAYHDATLTEAMAAGANVALTKPVRFDALYDLTQELLGGN